MNLYKISRDYKNVNYDEYATFVIRAKSIQRCKELAADKVKSESVEDEDEAVWLEDTTVEHLAFNVGGNESVIVGGL